MNFERINKLKKYTCITSKCDIEVSDLLLIDENNKMFLEYIIENNILIFKKNILKYLSDQYYTLDYMISKNYFLTDYYNIDILFDKSEDIPLIEKMYTKECDIFSYLSIDIIYRLFKKNNGRYMFENFLAINEDFCNIIISRVKHVSVLYNCLKDINRLDLMIFCNEKCWLSSINGKTVLEDLIDKNMNINYEVRNKSFETAKILFKKQKYETLLNMDANILINYPDSNNNYLKILIEKYNSGEKINFNRINFNNKNNLDLAKLYLMLLKNNITLSNYNLISLNIYNNEKPVLVHMLEIDEHLTLKYFDNLLVKKDIIKHLNIKYGINLEINNFNIDDIFKYIPSREKLKINLLSKKTIEESDIYEDDFLSLIDNNLTILEYAFKNNIKIYKNDPNNIQEAKIFIKYKKNINKISEDLLFENINLNQKLIDLLIENKYDLCVNRSVKNNIKIIDYCIKYNNFNIVNKNIIEELFVEVDGKFDAEKYLNNEIFLDFVKNYELSNDKKIKLYKNGFKKILINASEDLLLTSFNNSTILDDMLINNLSPTFLNYNFNSLETIKILDKYNRYDLFYKAKLELLINYPSKNNNYMQKLINLYKQGTEVNFLKIKYIVDDKELMSRCYIQMFKNDLGVFLNKLNENELLKKSNDNCLLYYLIKYDKETTLNSILTNSLKKNNRIETELKLLGVKEPLKSLGKIESREYDYKSIILNSYNDEYDKNIVSPVEDLLDVLKKIFESDLESDMQIVNSLIKSYRYLTSINPIFIEEVKLLINIKKNNPNFKYIKQLGKSVFNRNKGILVEDNTISTLNHETGHALHFFLTNFEIPDNYNIVLEKIRNNSDFIKKICDYSNKYQEIKTSILNYSKQIYDKYILSKEKNNDYIFNILNQEKTKIISYYVQKGYTSEMLNTILSETFTIEEFLEQKKQVQIEELFELIIRYDYDAFIAIGDIIDAITGGKFNSGLLKDKNNQKILPTCGHGIRYYSGCSNSKHFMFTEMVANYSTIIKSKKKEEALIFLKYIVGNELIELLDNFYKNKMLKLDSNKKIR